MEEKLKHGAEANKSAPFIFGWRIEGPMEQ
jgi:hypothetical protein